jgi:sugar phosphate isomerase/epimerase
LPGPEELVVQSGELFFNISLAEFSLHRMLWYGEIDHLDFAAIAKRDFGIDAVEYVTMFFNDKAKNHAYLDEMKQRADDLGVRGLLIMVDMQGNLVSKDQAERTRALQSHYAWVEAAQRLGCHSIRVNLPGKGTSEEIAGLAVESLGTLAEFAIPFGINILVEPHGGYSSNGAWLADVMRRVGRDNCGTLPDFGNFVMSLFPYRSYDRYKGVEELMPYAKGVSAKSSRFDDDGNDMVTDFYRMLKIVKDAGFTGHMGIEYEGSQLSEYDGIKATKALLIRAGRAVT